MTEPTFSPDDLPSNEDEIVSAVLDGAATPAEVERVQADPRLRARLAEFEAIRDQVASPVSKLDEVTRQRLLSAALAASEPAATDTNGDRVTSLPWWRRNAWAIGSAAAVILLAVLVAPALLSELTDNGDDDMVAVAGDSDAGSENDADSLGPTHDTYGFARDDANSDAHDESDAGGAEDSGDESSERADGQAEPEAFDAPPPSAPSDHELPVYPDIEAFEDQIRRRQVHPDSSLSPTTTIPAAIIPSTTMPATTPPATTPPATDSDGLTPVDELLVQCGSGLLDQVLPADRILIDQDRGVVDGERYIALVLLASGGYPAEGSPTIPSPVDPSAVEIMMVAVQSCTVAN